MKTILQSPALAVSLFLSPAVGAADWPQWRGPERNGHSVESVAPKSWPEGKPKLLWSAQVGTGFSSIAVASGLAYTLGNRDDRDIVWCFDARDGKEVWKHSYASELGDDLHEGGPSATPTIDGDRVYTQSKWGFVHCLDRASGKVIWKRDLRAEEGIRPNEWGLSGSPLVWKDLLILNVGTNGTALDRRTGKTVWTSGKKATGYASPLVFDGIEGTPPAVLIFAAKSLVAVRPETGKKIWSHPWKTGYDNNNADPIVLGKRILITSYDGGAACLEASATGVEVLYEGRSLQTHMAPPVLVGEYAYGFCRHYGRRPELRCVHLPTGKIAWRDGSLAAGSVMTAGEHLLVLDGKGQLVVAAANHESFTKIAGARVLEGRVWTPPALSDGRLFVRNSRGELRCYEVGVSKR